MAIEFTSQYIFAGAILALLCVFSSILSRRLGAPILLVFLVMGMLAGENGPGGILFNDYDLAFLLGNLALAVIIFDGGLGCRRETFRVSLRPALSLATLGVLVTAGITGAACYLILDLPWLECLLIGSIVASTDAAAVFGLLRTAGLELKDRTGATLEIESGTNDPMAIFLTVTLVSLLTTSTNTSGSALFLEIVQQFGLGLTAGFLGGWLLARLVRLLSLPPSLVPLFVLAGALSIFGITNLWGGSGFLAIYVVGAFVGNTPLPHGKDIRRFHDGIAWLGQIGMFLMLGLLITPSHLPPIILPAILLAAVLIFVARPLAVWLSLLPFHFPWREQLFISWCGLRGAVPIILALFPSLAGLEHTEVFFELVFFVVLISLVLQGWTIAPLARRLRIDLPPSSREPEHLMVPLPRDPEVTLHVYDVVPDSEASRLRSGQLPVSGGAQLVGVVRDGVMIDADRSATLQAGDSVIVLAPLGATKRLGGLFATPEMVRKVEPRLYFGDFVISLDAPLKTLAQMYGFELPEKFVDYSVARYISEKFHDKPVVGDRVRLGSVQFVVREISEGRIASVGLKLGRD